MPGVHNRFNPTRYAHGLSGALGLTISMTHPAPRKQALGLAGWLVASFVTGGIGAIASAYAASLYGELSQPSWAPPAWLFGPVWSVLYVLMGIAAWLVWREHGFRGAPTALRLFVAQLFANALWTWIFFVWRQGALSLAEIVVLWLLIASTILAFWRLHRLAALLLVPYLAWVSFATALTASLWRLNSAALG
jgi:tryptophan-rich sensory protein